MIKISSRGARILTKEVVCDGFYFNSRYRIQTHAHSDHTNKFATSLSKEVVATKPTLQILEVNHSIPLLLHRKNVHELSIGKEIEFDDCKIEFKDAMHMVGSVQVAVEGLDEVRYGYSGDFSVNACDNPIDVDYLLVDSTYGSPHSIRSFNQSEAFSCLFEIVGEHYLNKPIILNGKLGTIHKTINKICNAFPNLPILIGKNDEKMFEIFNNSGYRNENIFIDDQLDFKIIKIRHEGRYLRAYSSKSDLPSDISNYVYINLSGIFHRNSGPVAKHNGDQYTVAITDHADFEGTMRYVKSVNPKRVFTDPLSNPEHARLLSLEIRSEFKIKASVAEIDKSKNWGL
jgi:putative mRNA 3-end processing factor